MWTKAIVRPALFPARAAMSAVMVVPILAPIVSGKACSSVMIPAPSSGTRRDVVIELD